MKNHPFKLGLAHYEILLMFYPYKLSVRLLWLVGMLGTATISSNLLTAPGTRANQVVQSSQQAPETELLPVDGWFEAGSHPQDYAMGADQNTTYDGSASGTIQAKSNGSEGFGTLMQTFDASAYQGQRLRLRGYVKAESVADWAGMWMRVDSPAGQVLSFDNMQNRAIQGTTDWQAYDIVLDVPAEGNKIAFGLLLAGEGQVWMDNLQFEVVDAETPTTDMSQSSESNTLPESPANLSFETF